MMNRPMFLRKWHPNFSCLEEKTTTIPVWAKFHGIPMEYWNERGLGYVANVAGVLLYSDRPTLEKKRVSCARICMEILVSKEPIKEIDVLGDNGLSVILVSYDWIPDICVNCACFGHPTSNCHKVKSRPLSKLDKENRWLKSQIRVKKDGSWLGRMRLEFLPTPFSVSLLMSLSCGLQLILILA